MDKKRYTTKDIRYWASQGQSVSSAVVDSLLTETMDLQHMLVDVIKIIESEDPRLLRPLDKEALHDWKDRAIDYLEKHP